MNIKATGHIEKGIEPMSSRVNLHDNACDRYELSIGGLDYDFKYPTLEEIEPITQLYQEREKAEKEDTPESVDKIADIDNQLTEKLYSFVIPVNHTTPIRDTLKKQSYKVVKAFNKMMTDQLSAE